MTDRIDTKSAVMALFKELGLEPGVPISLYDIGPPLVAQGISQDSIVNALDALKDEGVIDLPGDNRLVLVRAI